MAVQQRCYRALVLQRSHFPIQLANPHRELLASVLHLVQLTLHLAVTSRSQSRLAHAFLRSMQVGNRLVQRISSPARLEDALSLRIQARERLVQRGNPGRSRKQAGPHLAAALQELSAALDKTGKGG